MATRSADSDSASSTSGVAAGLPRSVRSGASIVAPCEESQASSQLSLRSLLFILAMIAASSQDSYHCGCHLRF